MKNITSLIDFIKFLNKFREIQRIVYTKDHPHPENDAEHSFQLALTAWYIIDSQKINLNLSKILKYALAHDLVEIYAGDTYFFAPKTEMETKKQREEEAAHRIKSEFSEFPELHKIIEDYENKNDPESKFIYALDKVIPIINIYLDDGAGLKERKISLEMILSSKTPKVSIDPEIKKYFDELIEILKKEEKKLFNL